MVRVLINHGWTNRRVRDQWHRTLAVALRNAGHHVYYPQFPNTETPIMAEWQELLVEELDHLHESGSGETIFIGHSLGCINFLQTAAAGKIKPAIDRVLLVAPAAPEVLGEIPNSFIDLNDPEVKAAAHAAAKQLFIVGSDKDPWTPRGLQETFGDPLGVKASIIVGAGHLGREDNWSSWQGVYDWVLDPTADITKR